MRNWLYDTKLTNMFVVAVVVVTVGWLHETRFKGLLENGLLEDVASNSCEC